MSTSIDELADCLVASAATDLSTARAATCLLVEHGYWLTRNEFVARYVHSDDTAAWVAWPQLGEDLDDAFAPVCTTRERAVLDAALALAHSRGRVNLADLVVGTDSDTVQLVMQALAEAAQWPERGIEAQITGF